IALRTTVAGFALAIMFALVKLSAQEPGSVPETKTPALQQTAPLAHPDNDYWRKHDAQLLTDFPGLARFKEADLKLGPPVLGENRVVFMGDSITEGWHFDGPSPAFAGKPRSEEHTSELQSRGH